MKFQFFPYFWPEYCIFWPFFLTFLNFRVDESSFVTIIVKSFLAPCKWVFKFRIFKLTCFERLIWLPYTLLKVIFGISSSCFYFTWNWAKSNVPFDLHPPTNPTTHPTTHQTGQPAHPALAGLGLWLDNEEKKKTSYPSERLRKKNKIKTLIILN